MSIASIQAEIDEYQAKIDKYNAILAKVATIPPYVSKCSKASESLGGYTSFIVINGEPIDGGAVGAVDKNINTINEYIAEIIEQGNQLIEKYTKLKEEALRRMAALLAELEKSRRESASNNYNYSNKTNSSSTSQSSIRRTRSINQLK